MKKILLGVVIAVMTAIAAPLPIYSATAPVARVGVQLLPKPGEKIPLGAKHYFTYGFTKQPKLGTAIMRVEIFTHDGVPDTSFIVKGDADMPSMRGAHSSGGKDFSISARRAYLLPLRLVMPGDWEVSFTFIKEAKTVFMGVYLLDL